MAKNHSSVAYVEPNYVFSGLTAAANDGDTHDRAPDLDEYCIALDIIVELSSRHNNLNMMNSENKVIVMSYRSDSGSKENVRFMSGSRVGGFEKTNTGEYAVKLSGQNVLTSYYADMHITDLVDYGTTEMLGIKSVDIDYNSTCVPVINVRFTDVRGMSIFQPSELNDDISFNGIRGFSKDNIAQSFFHAFFTLPIPKFTVILKGFYGEPVSYQVMCDKFETAFDSKNGYFDVSTRFIGFAYSFMADVSFNALLAAPYSDYEGEKYWDTQVKGKRFMVTDKNGSPVDMPKLYDIRKTFETLVIGSDDKAQLSALEEEVDNHEIEIQELSKIRGMYRVWYDALYNIVTTKYGKDFCYRLGGNTEDEDYKAVVIFTNGKNIAGADLSGEYLQFDEGFRTLTGELKNAIDQFNQSNSLYRKLDNIKEGFKYPRVRTFREIWFNDRTNLLMFDGFHSDNILPKKETIDTIFGTETSGQQRVLRKLYNDGKYQYIDAFVIDLDYTDIKRRIKSLIEDAAKQTSDKAKERKALNRHMYEKLGWYPTVENFTKIVMAHLETLMHMMYKIVRDTANRTVASLGVPIGEDGLVDVNSLDANVAPFPRLTNQVIDADGYTKVEDVWAGTFTNGEGFREVDIVNGIFNGVSKISQLEEIIETAVANINSEANSEDAGTTVSVMPMPITSYDFINGKNPYGSDSDVTNDIYAFAGKVCMRMFGIMQLSYFRSKFKDNWPKQAEKLGIIEAKNFLALNKITNTELLSALGENGILKNGEELLKIVKGETDGKLPWDNGNNGGKVLFKGGDSFWLERYRGKQRGVYPIQNISFAKMDEMLGVINAGKTPIENNDITIIDSYAKCTENFSRIMKLTGDTTIMNTVKFTTKYKEIWEIFNNAEASGCEEYKAVMTALAPNIVPGNLPNFIDSSNSTFCNKVPDNVLLDAKGGKNIKIIDDIRDTDDNMFAGPPGGDKKTYYTYDGGSYTEEMVARNIESYTLTQCYGYKKENGLLYIDKRKSLFLMKDYQNISNGISNGSVAVFSHNVLKCAYFLMGIDAINYQSIIDSIGDDIFGYIPNLAALQIGAAIGVYYSKRNLQTPINMNVVRKTIPLPDGFDRLKGVIDKMSPYCKLGYAKHFRDWGVLNSWRIKQLYVTEKNGKFSCKGDHYEKIINYEPNIITDLIADADHRALFRQTSDIVKYLTNELMSLISVVKLTIGANDIISGDDGKQRDATMAYTYKIDESQAKVYLDAFLKTVREGNNIPSSEEGSPTTIANSPSQTNDDMKIELYRYLKQLYDKWVSCTTFDTWLFDKFFEGKEEEADTTSKTSGDTSEIEKPLGNKFFFIDSFYNKIGDKLLINPKKVSEVIKLATSSMDTNTMMYNFLSQVYGEHRCMMKCVQNFKLLSKGIADIFKPISYEEMQKLGPLSDFVVVYTYEPSRNLNVANSEFKDDGFMLNDEFETPLPIKSRGDENRFYKIPAFGVSYGRQYQHYFKSVNVNMAHPVMTEQAIIAKHNILAASRNKTFKNATAQDLYDIYSNQSYTCVVEMMGCAYVQPLMYFVLLNVPFFRGSYLISKVRHKITPGDMTTEITGVRMSKYCNKMVTEIFTDEDDDTLEGGSFGNDTRYQKADTSNDCPYKVFPIIDDNTTGEESSTVSQDQITVGKLVMKELIAKGCNKALAAGIAGNMSVETGFDPKALNPSDRGYMSGGLCQWRGGNLKSLIDNTPSKHGRIENSSARKYKATTSDSDRYNSVKNSLPSSADQITYLVESMKKAGTCADCSYVGKGKTIFTFSQFNAINNPEEAARKFREYYEKSEHPEPERWKRANKFYNSYTEGDNTSKAKQSDSHSQKKFPELFVNAIQKSLNSTEKYAAELKVTYTGGDAHITIDNGGEKLAVLFDIILNSQEYYSHITRLDWLINNSPSELPRSLMVRPSQNVQSRQILIGNNKKSWSTQKFTGKECNEKFMQSIVKKYSSMDKEIFARECPQFSNVKNEVLNEFKPADCNTLYGNSSVNSNGGGEMNEGGMIYNWDAKKAAGWLRCASTTKSQHICAFAVQQAVIAGGIPFERVPKYQKSCSGYRVALNLQETGHWDLVASGTVDEKTQINFKPQIGDIIGMTKGSETGAYGHVCMYCGPEDGWISDYKQKQAPYPYSNPGKYWIVRYKGGAKSTTAKPGRCYGGKCLNNCSV